MNNKSAFEILDEAADSLRKRKQARYLGIAGFACLAAYGLSRAPVFLAIAVVLLVGALFRRIQLVLMARQDKAGRSDSVLAAGPHQPGVDADTSFGPARVSESIALGFGQNQYELSLLHKRRDWEDDDILLCQSDGNDVKLHPSTFLDQLKSAECSFFHKCDQSVIEHLRQAPCMRFGYLEDSREYPAISIEGRRVNIKCKYLCPEFYLVDAGADVLLVVDGLIDEGAEEIPTILARLQEHALTETTAAFCEEDNLWVRA